MDSAGDLEIRYALTQQGILLGRQQEEIQASHQALTSLSQQLTAISQRLDQIQIGPSMDPAAATLDVEEASPPRRSEPRLNPPAPYSGEPTSCRSFLSQCSLTFSLQPSCFPTDESKIAFIIMHLAGSAREWGTAMWDNKHECCSSYSIFSQELRKVIDRSALGNEAARALSLLRQGTRTLSDYAIEFRSLAASSGWNSMALWDHFLHGLAEQIKDEIYSLELLPSLDGLVELATRVDFRLALRSQHRNMENRHESFDLPSSARGATSPRVGFSEEEPMQIGRAHLTARERRHRIAHGLSLYCGEAGHMVTACPYKRQPLSGERSRTVSVTAAHCPLVAGLLSRRLLQSEGVTHTVAALVDSGAEGDFMDIELARRWGIPIFPLAESISAKTLCGTPLTRITAVTGLVHLITSGNHTEEIRFLLIHSPSAPIVLGHTWLIKHNPFIDWAHHTVLEWSRFCLSQCLVSASSPVMSVSVLQGEPVDLARVPVAYHDLRAVFSKSRASSLPPHRPYECAIDLLPGTSPPKGRLYSLSGPEREAIDKYIN